MKDNNGIPKGYVHMENARAVYISDDRIVIVGVPDEEVAEHNCDYMGCGSIGHVIFRATLNEQWIGG